MTTTITLWNDRRSRPVTARLFFGDFRENQVRLDFWLRGFSHVALCRCLDGLLARFSGFNVCLIVSVALAPDFGFAAGATREFSGAFAVGHGERHSRSPTLFNQAEERIMFPVMCC